MSKPELNITTTNTPAEQLPVLLREATRGLTVAQYRRAFDCGARAFNRHPDEDLDQRLARYMKRRDARNNPIHAAQEGAWLDGNTFGDEWPSPAALWHLQDRENHPENY